MTIYALPLSAGDVRHWLRRQFERNRHVTDARVLDVLTAKVNELLSTAGLRSRRSHRSRTGSYGVPGDYQYLEGVSARHDYVHPRSVRRPARKDFHAEIPRRRVQIVLTQRARHRR